jgi:RimJ/RimL family protein N-acetyltransferase
MDFDAKYRDLVMPVVYEPRKVRLETPNYILRTLEPDDASDAWSNWLQDDQTVRMLNARPELLTAQAMRDYVSRADHITSHVLGIFEKETGQLVGIRAIYVDLERREFQVNVLVGETQARNKGARTETRNVLYQHFFEDRDLLAARCTILAHNEQVLRLMDRGGWVHEHTDFKPSVNGGPAVELRHFRMSRESWRGHKFNYGT